MLKLLTVAIAVGLSSGGNLMAAKLFYLPKPVEAPCDYNPFIQCWTNWFDRDNPSETGDWENLYDLRKENAGKICPKPMQIEALTLSGLTSAAAGDVIHMSDTVNGFVCLNSQQPEGKEGKGGVEGEEGEEVKEVKEVKEGKEGKEGEEGEEGEEDKVSKVFEKCEDYKVRFSCHPPFCGGVLAAVCWTKWYDRDNPSGTGDWELLSNLRSENPGEICEFPLYVEAVTTGPSTAAVSTGEDFYIYSSTQGLVCRNQDQKDKFCLDYKVRFGCPCYEY